MIYIFDVDGTLTPSRGVMESRFKEWFIDFSKRNRVHLVTGSDYEKTVEQVGTEVLDNVESSFNCSGNAIYQKHDLVYRSDWQCPDDLWLYLEDRLYQSPYIHKFGKHFEERIGMLNFSIVGRNASGMDRTDYYNWDKIHSERIKLSETINEKWKDIQAVVGGETGIDIFKRGTDKSQILNHIDSDNIVFFGDRMDINGNDYSLARDIIDSHRGICYNVNIWTDTQTILKAIWSNESVSPANGSTKLDR